MIFIVAEGALVSQSFGLVDLLASSVSLIVSPLARVRLQAVIESAQTVGNSVADFSFIVRIESD